LIPAAVSLATLHATADATSQELVWYLRGENCVGGVLAHFWEFLAEEGKEQLHPFEWGE
jgi:hypothetical protein